MSKIDDARDILEQLGLPEAQRNDISCLTLLALTGLYEDDAWSQASRPSRSIHQILGFMRDVYEREYAENTRQTVRRQVIHQFEQPRIVDRNPDEPDLPTNSPRTHYGLTDDALKVLRLYQTGGWESEHKSFAPATALSWRYTSDGGGCGRYPSALRGERRFAYPQAGTTYCRAKW